MDMFIRYSSK